MKGLAESSPFHLLTNPQVINWFIFLSRASYLLFMPPDPGHKRAYLNIINENISSVSTQLIAYELHVLSSCISIYSTLLKKLAKYLKECKNEQNVPFDA